jgi:hypothetical protein
MAEGLLMSITETLLLVLLVTYIPVLPSARALGKLPTVTLKGGAEGW